MFTCTEFIILELMHLEFLYFFEMWTSFKYEAEATLQNPCMYVYAEITVIVHFVTILDMYTVNCLLYISE